MRFNINFRNIIRNRKPIRKRQWIIFSIYVLLVGFLFYLGIYHQTTGLYPISILNRTEYILPPNPDFESQTFEQVINFINNDNTNTIAYDKGFNCVDSVFRVFLNARWQGIAALPISILYDDSPDAESIGHMVIAFYTMDKGTVFFETQNDRQIRPRVGEYYNDKKIRGLYYMDITWEPIDNSPECQPKMKAQ